MIVNPPRSSAELSPRLRAISVFAVDQFEPRKQLPWWFTGGIMARVAILIACFSLTLLSRQVLILWSTSQATPSFLAQSADQFRALAHSAEDSALAYRRMAAGKDLQSLPPGDPLRNPAIALQMAKGADMQAALYLHQAYLQECLNQGVPPR